MGSTKMAATSSAGTSRLKTPLLELVEPALPIGHVEDAGQQRPEAGVVLGLRRGQADRAVGPAVEGAQEGDHVWRPRVVAGQLERRLDRLGARVAEEDARPGPTSARCGRARPPAGRRSAGRSRTRRSGAGRPPARRSTSTTRGWLWPVEVTAMPAVKSRNRLPSMSSTVSPRPARARAGTRAAGWAT